MRNSALAPMRSAFTLQMRRRLGELEALRLAVNAGLDPMRSAVEIGQISHRISGVAETLGFAQIGDLAMEVDFKIAALVKEKRPLEPVWDVVQPILEDLQDEIETIVVNAG